MALEQFSKMNLEPITPILPEWLTMMYCTGICQVCKNPSGQTMVFSMNNQHNACNRLGFYTCSKKECENYMDNYIKNIHKDLYKSNIWYRVLHKISNRSNVHVLRSNGTIDTNWKISLSRYSVSEENSELMDKNPLFKLFITAMLCAKEKYDFRVCNDIWENIFRMTLELYIPHVHLIFGSGLEKYIMVYQENIDPSLNIEKLVNIDTL